MNIYAVTQANWNVIADNKPSDNVNEVLYPGLSLHRTLEGAKAAVQKEIEEQFRELDDELEPDDDKPERTALGWKETHPNREWTLEVDELSTAYQISLYKLRD